MKKVYSKYNQPIEKSLNSMIRIIESLGLVWEAFWRRKILLLSLVALIILLPIFYLVYKYQSPIQAAWFDDTWGYRQTVAVTNAGTAQTDYQVAITLNTSALVTAGNPEERLLAPVFYVHAPQERVYGARMQSDCDDIRENHYRYQLSSIVR